jgi:hypothetical protein
VVTVDREYSHALGIEAILDLVSYLGSCNWEIIVSDDRVGKFLTSDFPTAVDVSDISEPMIRVFPVAPDIAVVVHPSGDRIRGHRDLNFKIFRYRRRFTTSQIVAKINDFIVKAAEKIIVSDHHDSWLDSFIRKRAKYHLTLKAERISTANGFMLVNSLKYIQKH